MVWWSMSMVVVNFLRLVSLLMIRQASSMWHHDHDGISACEFQKWRGIGSRCRRPFEKPLSTLSLSILLYVCRLTSRIPTLGTYLYIHHPSLNVLRGGIYAVPQLWTPSPWCPHALGSTIAVSINDCLPLPARIHHRWPLSQVSVSGRVED
jgi:hypothetical protein